MGRESHSNFRSFLMVYKLGYKTNIFLGQEVLSQEFSVISYGAEPQTLRVDMGGLLVNGIKKGSEAEVIQGDSVQIYVRASTEKGSPVFVSLTQNGNLSGDFIVISSTDSGLVFNSSYLGLESYEILNSSGWTPGSVRYINIYNLSNEATLRVDLNSNPIEILPKYRIHIHDYYRNLTYLFDGAKGLFSGVLPIEYEGPVSDSTMYTASGQRSSIAVAYRKSNLVVVYDPFYKKLVEIYSKDPIKIESRSNVLFILEKDSTFLRKLVFSDTSTYSEVQSDFGLIVLDFVLRELSPAVLTLTSLVDFDGTSYTDIIEDTYKIGYSSNTDTFILGHAPGAGITYCAGPEGLRQFYKRNVNFLYFMHMEDITDSNTSLFVDDGDHSVWSQDTSARSNPINKIFDMPGPSFGVASIGSLLFIPNIYEDIDSKFNTAQTDIDPINFGEKQIGQVGTQIESEEVIIAGITTGLFVFLPKNTSQNLALSLNGSIVISPTEVVNGDALKIVVTSLTEIQDYLYIPVVIGQSIYEFKLLPNNTSKLPIRLVFKPVSTEGLSTQCGGRILIEGLGDGVEAEVSVDLGTLEVNDNKLYLDSVTVSDGDSLTVCLDPSPTPCEEVTARIEFSNKFTTLFSVITKDISEPSASLENVTDNKFNINSVLDGIPLGQSVRSSEALVVLSNLDTALLILPNIYNSYLVLNGSVVTNTHRVKHGDVIQVGLTTTFNYNTDHVLPILFCNNVFDWIVRTTPDLVADHFYFGFLSNLHMAERVLSEVVTVSGLDSGVGAPMVLPYGLRPILNGKAVDLDSVLLDYRGVLKDTYTMYISNGDTIQLDGYPKPTYGTLNTFRITIGFISGVWELETSPSAGYCLSESDCNIKIPRKGVSYSSDTPASASKKSIIHTRGFSTPIKSIGFKQTFSVYLAPKFISAVDLKSSLKLSPFRLFEKRIALAQPAAKRSLPRLHTDCVNNLSYVSNSSFIESGSGKTVLFKILFNNTLLKPGILTSDSAKIYVIPRSNASVVSLPEVIYKVSVSNLLALTRSTTWVHSNILDPNLGTLVQPDIYAIVYPVKFFVTFSKRFESTEYYFGSYFKTRWTVEPPKKYNFYSRSWIDYETYKSYRMSSPNFIHFASKDFNAWSSPFYAPPRKNYITFRGKFLRNSGDSSQTVSNKFFTIPQQKIVTDFNVTFKASQSSFPITAPSFKSHVFNGCGTIGKPPQYKVTEECPRVSYPSGAEVSVNSKVVYKSRVNSVDSITYSDSNLGGTFESSLLAETDAESRGLISGSYMVISYLDRFIWTRDIPCNNMCGPCPISGYIQGG
jgi:hypothetical protein